MSLSSLGFRLAAQRKKAEDRICCCDISHTLRDVRKHLKFIWYVLYIFRSSCETDWVGLETLTRGLGRPHWARFATLLPSLLCPQQIRRRHSHAL